MSHQILKANCHSKRFHHPKDTNNTSQHNSLFNYRKKCNRHKFLQICFVNTFFWKFMIIATLPVQELICSKHFRQNSNRKFSKSYSSTKITPVTVSIVSIEVQGRSKFFTKCSQITSFPLKSGFCIIFFFQPFSYFCFDSKSIKRHHISKKN